MKESSDELFFLSALSNGGYSYNTSTLSITLFTAKESEKKLCCSKNAFLYRECEFSLIVVGCILPRLHDNDTFFVEN